jgi:hypothetical protein
VQSWLTDPSGIPAGRNAEPELLHSIVRNMLTRLREYRDPEEK